MPIPYVNGAMQAVESVEIGKIVLAKPSYEDDSYVARYLGKCEFPNGHLFQILDPFTLGSDSSHLKFRLQDGDKVYVALRSGEYCSPFRYAQAEKAIEGEVAEQIYLASQSPESTKDERDTLLDLVVEASENARKAKAFDDAIQHLQRVLDHEFAAELDARNFLTSHGIF